MLTFDCRHGIDGCHFVPCACFSTGLNDLKNILGLLRAVCAKESGSIEILLQTQFFPHDLSSIHFSFVHKLTISLHSKPNSWCILCILRFMEIKRCKNHQSYYVSFDFIVFVRIFFLFILIINNLFREICIRHLQDT